MENTEVKPFDLDAKIHPDLKEAFSQFPKSDGPLTKENVLERREGFLNFIKIFPKLSFNDVTTTAKTVPGPKDAPDISLAIHRPTNKDGKLPALLWIHGGGYYTGNTDLSYNFCVTAAHEVGCLVVSNSYRLAPENPYPAGLEDCYAVLTWMRDSAGELGIDVDRIAVGGHSAGGGLCVALTLLARDRGGPKICLQMPLYPMIDDRSVTVSSHQITDTRGWNRGNNLAAWSMYLGDEANKEISPYAAAARAKDLSGLPPTYTFIGELDVFRDETVEYVTRLGHAGVPVEFHLYPGCFHGFEAFVHNAKISKRVAREQIEVLNSYLNP